MLRLCFKYDRKLLGLLSQRFYASVKELFQDAAPEPRSLPGMIASRQTYGDDPTRFHLHSLVTDGLVSPQDSLVPVPCPDPVRIMELFRHKLVKAPLARHKISPRLVEIMQNWRHPGFSVFAGPAVDGAAQTLLEAQGRHITRPALAMDALQELEDGRLALETRQDPRTGATLVALDPLEWIHRITAHIPDPGRHCQRFYGAYSNRGRVGKCCAQGDGADAGANPHEDGDNSDFSREVRSTWARLIRKIVEADPLTCACGARMRIVAFITDPRVVDRILRHRESGCCQAKDPFEPRAPPRVHARTLR